MDTNDNATSWNPASSATPYLLQVNDGSGNPGNKWYSASAAGCAGGSGSCSLPPDTTLAPGSDKWWIQTWNVHGYGPWSNGMSYAAP